MFTAILLLCVYAALTIGFTMETFSVTEGINSSVEICAAVLAGQIGTSVTVPFSTVQGSATSMFVCMCLCVCVYVFACVGNKQIFSNARQVSCLFLIKSFTKTSILNFIKCFGVFLNVQHPLIIWRWQWISVSLLVKLKTVLQ